jgi:hypothetical protein
VIDRYIAESIKKIGKTKAQVLKSIKKYDIADLGCGNWQRRDIGLRASTKPDPHAELDCQRRSSEWSACGFIADDLEGRIARRLTPPRG